eukprot:scaffold6709_cov69-Phaeocystis_antarctica.AAC.2
MIQQAGDGTSRVGSVTRCWNDCGMTVWEGSEGEHTNDVAVLEHTLQLSRLATPPESMKSPPPCQNNDRQFKRRAHKGSEISVHVGVGQRCRAHDVESPAESLPKPHIVRSPSRDVQPDQLSPASGRDIDDPPRSLGVEHDAPGHLRLDSHVAVDAERRTAIVGAHVVGELVGARHQHDPAHRAIAECHNEVTRADRVTRAGLQRRRGRGRGRRGRRGRRRGRRRCRGRRGRRGRQRRRRGRS